MVSYSPSIATKAVSLAVYEILDYTRLCRDMTRLRRGLAALPAASRGPWLARRLRRDTRTRARTTINIRIQRQKWRDLELGVSGCSKSLKMAPFDRPYATSYWSAIVSIPLSCTIFELFDVE